jgi:hypothetical protein
VIGNVRELTLRFYTPTGGWVKTTLRAYPKTEGGPRLAPSAYGFSDRF